MTLRRLALAAALALWACGGDTLVGAGGKCGGGARCEEGTRCFDGECRPELGTECDERVAQCLPGGACQGGVCKGEGGSRCGDGVECLLGFSCEENSCSAGPDGVCGDGIGVRCSSGLVCAQGRCRVGEGGTCDGAALVCVDPLVCSGGACVFRPGAACSHAGTCAEGYECVSGTCRGESGSACSDEVQCDRGLVCEVGFCRGVTGAACVATNDCADGWACEDGRCLGGAGVECVASTECLTTFVCHAGRCAGGPGAICDAEAPCAPGGVCEQGVCRVPRGGECGDGQACADGLTCVDRRCRGDVGVACLATSDCATGLTCEDEVCRSPNGGLCDGDDDCLAGLTCENERCRGSLGAPCGASATCATGLSCDDSVCLVNVGGGCDTGGECAFGNVCEAQACVVPNGGACVATTECAATLTCEENVCVGTPGSGCEPGLCGAALLCVDGSCRSQGGGGCGATAECLAGFTCEDHVCRAGPAGECSSTVPCRSPLTCENGTCRVPALAECASDAECPSGYDCSEGTCRGVAGTGCAGDATCAVGLSCVADACIPTLTFATSGSVSENAPGELVFTLSAPAKAAVTIPYAVAGTASEADHAVRAGSVVIPLGQTRAVVALAPTDDPTDEPDETLVLSIGEVAHVVLGEARTSTWTITDDDAPPVVGFTADSQEVPENTEDSVTVAVELSAASAFTVTVEFAPGEGSATHDIDYRRTGAETTLTFAPGETRKELGLTLVDDNVSEGPEAAVFTLAAPEHATLGTDTHTLTIVDDEPLPVIQFVGTRATVGEGSTMQVEVRTNVVISNPITVRLAVSGTAGADDVAAVATAVTIGGHQRSALVTVKALQDLFDEDEETVELELLEASPGSLGAATRFTVTIADDDAPPLVSFSDYVPHVVESAGRATIDLVLSAPSGRTVTAAYALGGTAQAPADHDLVAGTVTFAPGQQRVGLSFNLVNDDEVEEDERVNLALTGATNASIGPMGFSFVGIEDEDKGRFLNVTDVAVGSSYACALSDGEVRCWGNGRDYPRPVAGLSANVSSICAGAYTTCATAAGSLYCWNGVADTASRVPGLETDVTDVSCGSQHICVLQGGVLKCWGRNDRGQLGIGNNNTTATPTAVVGLTGAVRSFSAAVEHTCAVVEGAVYCWGGGSYGGATGPSAGNVPQLVVARGATMVTTGDYHSCAIIDGVVQCWGLNGDGQLLGDPNRPRISATPAPVLGLPAGTATLVDAGSSGTCAVIGGKARCWGTGLLNENLRAGTATPALPFGDPDLDSGVTGLSVGGYACAVRDTRAKCWGTPTTARAHGTRSDLSPGRPVDIVGLPATTTGLFGTYVDPQCATAPDGIRCWGPVTHDGVTYPPSIAATFAGAPLSIHRSGYDYRGVLVGDGMVKLRAAPLVGDAVEGLEGGIVAAASGLSHTCVIRAGGRVECSGSNFWGQLGGPSGGAFPTAPVVPAGLESGAKLIAAGYDNACAVSAGNKVLCWGFNFGGAAPREFQPVPENVSKLVMGPNNDACAVALTTDGGVVRLGCGWNVPWLPPAFQTGVTDIGYSSSGWYVLQGGVVKFIDPGNGRTVEVPGLSEVDALVPTPWYIVARKGGRILAYGATGAFGYGSNHGRVDWVPKYVFEMRRP